MPEPDLNKVSTPKKRNERTKAKFFEDADKLIAKIEALKAIARDIKGQCPKPVNKNDGATHISVANLSYVTRADNYARFIEQYDSLSIDTNEEMYMPSTHRAKLDALRGATSERNRRRSQIKHLRRTTRQTSLHRRRQPDERLYFRQKLYQIEIQNNRRTIQKHRQNPLRPTVAVA